MAKRERFGIWSLTLLVVASMIGAGAFTTSGYVLENLGSPFLVVVAWLIGGAIALAGAVGYGRLARAMPESGGEYLFLSRAAHPLLGFIAGWVSLIAGFTGAIAFAATALESYIVPAGQRPSWLPQDTIAVAVVVLAGFAHGIRPRGGAAVQNVAVLIKLGFLVGFLLFAASKLGSGQWKGASAPHEMTGAWMITTAFATSLVWISLSYSGFNAAVYIAGEAKAATTNVPAALVTGTVLVLALYVLLNAVFVYGPPPEEIAGRSDVAAIAGKWLGGSHLEKLVRWVISLALLTSVLSMLMAAPRVYAKMAEDGVFPKMFQHRGDSPRQAIALQVLLAVIFILVSSLRGLLSYLGLTLSLCAAVSVACLFLPGLRRRQPKSSLAIPVFYIVCTLGAALIMACQNPSQIVGTLLTFALGACAYYAAQRWK